MLSKLLPLHPFARLLLWCAAAFALIMASQPASMLGNPYDKLMHMAAFAVLALLAAFAYPRAPLLVILVSLSAFGALIELVQMIPALNRSTEWLDWTADTFAAAVVLGCVFVVRRLGRRAAT